MWKSEQCPEALSHQGTGATPAKAHAQSQAVPCGPVDTLAVCPAQCAQQHSKKTKKEAFQTKEQKQDVLTYVTMCLGHLAWLPQQGAERVPPLSLLHKHCVSTPHMCTQLRGWSLRNAVHPTKETAVVPSAVQLLSPKPSHLSGS